MGFFEDVNKESIKGFFAEAWKKVQRLYMNKCPKCKVNDADLPDEDKICVRLIHQEKKHWLSTIGVFRGPNGPVGYRKPQWVITERLLCRKCGHTWIATREDASPSKHKQE